MTNQLYACVGNLPPKLRLKEFATRDEDIDWPGHQPRKMTVARIRVSYRLSKGTTYRGLVDRCHDRNPEPVFQMYRDKDAAPVLSVGYECLMLAEPLS